MINNKWKIVCALLILCFMLDYSHNNFEEKRKIQNYNSFMNCTRQFQYVVNPAAKEEIDFANEYGYTVWEYDYDDDKCDYCYFIVSEKINEYYSDIFSEYPPGGLCITSRIYKYYYGYDVLGFYTFYNHNIFISCNKDCELTFHHEMMHYMDDIMGYLLDDPEWEALNPNGFRYGYDDMLRPGFARKYGMMNMQEDKTTIYETFFTHQNGEITDEIVIAKRNLLLKRLTEWFPSFAEIPELRDFV